MTSLSSALQLTRDRGTPPHPPPPGTTSNPFSGPMRLTSPPPTPSHGAWGFCFSSGPKPPSLNRKQSSQQSGEMDAGYTKFLRDSPHPAPAGPSGRALPALPSPAPIGPAQDLCPERSRDPGFHGPLALFILLSYHPRAWALRDETASEWFDSYGPNQLSEVSHLTWRCPLFLLDYKAPSWQRKRTETPARLRTFWMSEWR